MGALGICKLLTVPDNIAQPFDFAIEDMPPEVVEAFGSVIGLNGVSECFDEHSSVARLIHNRIVLL